MCWWMVRVLHWQLDLSHPWLLLKPQRWGSLFSRCVVWVNSYTLDLRLSALTTRRWGVAWWKKSNKANGWPSRKRQSNNPVESGREWSSITLSTFMIIVQGMNFSRFSQCAPISSPVKIDSCQLVVYVVGTFNTVRDKRAGWVYARAQNLENPRQSPCVLFQSNRVRVRAVFPPCFLGRNLRQLAKDSRPQNLPWEANCYPLMVQIVGMIPFYRMFSGS